MRREGKKITQKTLLETAEITKYQYFNWLRKTKTKEQKNKKIIEQILYVYKFFVKNNTYGSKRLAKLINKKENSNQWSKFKIDRLKHFLHKNPQFFPKNFSLVPFWEQRRKKKGLSKSNRKSQAFKADCAIEQIEKDKLAVCSDWTEINEIKFPQNIKLLVCLHFTPYNKILSCVISCNANGNNTRIGLKEAIKHLKKPSKYYYHTDQGKHYLCSDTQVIIDEYKIKRSNTTFSMKTKKLTEPIFGIMKNEVIYNNKWNGSRKDNLKRFIALLEDWIYHFNNNRIFYWDNSKENLLAKKELKFYKSSKNFHATFKILNTDKTLEF